ncbi:MAG: S1 RNA-binding domain-containing protein [Firmicutes bacterium]|nr:S1 RNA-binding domain-containing protein [Bacillota bacterium]
MADTKLYQLNETVIGTITKIAPYGAFMSFPNGQNGLVHISEISKKFVRNVDSILAVGQKLQVKIIDIDPTNNYLRLSLKKIEIPAIPKASTSKKKRVQIPIADIDFSLLEKKLPEWINETLKKENK